MSDEVNPLIAAFLKLQDENHPNIFEAAKKAKKDYDKDGKIESEKDEVWGSRFRAAKKAGKMHEAALKDPKDPSVQGSGDVTSSPMRHVRPTNPDRIKNMKDPRDLSVQGSGDVTKNNKPVSVREGSTWGERTKLRLVKTYTNGNKTSKVYRDHDWGEYRVKHYTDNTHHKDADYHTDDKEDAHDTAKHFIRDVKEGIASDMAKGAATFASDIARAYKGGYGTSARSATGQFTKPGPVTGAAQNIARSAGARPGAGAATGAAVGTAAAIGANRPKSDHVQTSTPMSSSAPEKKMVSAPTPPSRPKYMTRGQAFAAARKEAGGAGGKFTYGGKEYHTGIKGEKVPSKLKPTSVKEETLNEAPMISPPVINQPSPAVQGQRLQSNRYYAGQSYSASGSGTGSFSKTMSASPTQVKSNVPATKSPTAPAGGGGGKEPPIKTTYTRLGDREIKPPSKLGALGKAAATVATSAALGKMMSDRYKEQHGSQHSATAGVSAKDSMDRMRAMGTKSTAPASVPTPPSRPKYMTRGQAFSAARKEAGGAGGKFTYGGKEYQTNVKGERYSKAPKTTSVKEDEEFDLEGFINEALDVGYTIDDVANYLDETYQLDEVSKEKINRYMKKAVDSYGQKSFNQGVNSMASGSDSDRRMYKKKAESRQKSMGKAVDKLSGRAKVNATEEVTEDKDPCWKDYKMVGMKNKGNRKVPNCVPKEEVEFSEEELAYFESVAPFDSDETTDSSVSTKSPRRTLTDEKKCKK